MSVKMSKQPPPAPTASAVGPCPNEIQIVGLFILQNVRRLLTKITILRCTKGLNF